MDTAGKENAGAVAQKVRCCVVLATGVASTCCSLRAPCAALRAWPRLRPTHRAIFLLLEVPSLMCIAVVPADFFLHVIVVALSCCAISTPGCVVSGSLTCAY